MRNWYSINNRINSVVDVELNDAIGVGGISAADFINELKQHKNARKINLSVHSPGGNMLDGFAMYNALKAHPAKVYAHVSGIAASAASMVLMAGDVISMPEDAFIMVHNPMGVLAGGSEDMRDYADMMDKLKASAVRIYSKKTGKTKAEISRMLDQETWLNSNEALKHGFIDTITDAVGVAAKANVFNKHFKTMPFSSSSARVDKIESPYQFEKFLTELGFCPTESRALTNKIASLSKKQAEEKALNTLSSLLSRIKIPRSLNG